MKNTLFHFLILFIALLVAQVICSKIILFGVAMPIIYIYLILRLPLSYSLNWTLTIAFLFGLFVDMFNNTQGMNALACTVMTIMRRPVFDLFILKDDGNGSLSSSSLRMNKSKTGRLMMVITVHASAFMP